MNKEFVEELIVGISSVAVSGVDIIAMSGSDYDSQADHEDPRMAVDEELWRDPGGHQVDAGQIRGHTCNHKMRKEDVLKFDQALKVLIETTKNLRRQINAREPEHLP